MRLFIEVDSNDAVVGYSTQQNDSYTNIVETPHIPHIEDTEIIKLDRNTMSLVVVADNEIVQEKQKETLKQEKIKAVSQITVTTTTGKVFDGDELSQDRMMRAINIANITNQTTTNWKLADNTIVLVTLDELKEALALAGQEMSRIWLE